MGFCNKVSMNLLEVAVTLSHVEGNPECDQAREESTACQANAVATFTVEGVKASSELGEAKRNCRFIINLNTCIDELVAVCPSMLGRDRRVSACQQRRQHR